MEDSNRFYFKVHIIINHNDSQHNEWPLVFFILYHFCWALIKHHNSKVSAHGYAFLEEKTRNNAFLNELRVSNVQSHTKPIIYLAHFIESHRFFFNICHYKWMPHQNWIIRASTHISCMRNESHKCSFYWVKRKYFDWIWSCFGCTRALSPSLYIALRCFTSMQ